MKKFSIIQIGGQNTNLIVNNGCKNINNTDYERAGIVLYSFKKNKINPDNIMKSIGNIFQNKKKLYFLLSKESSKCPSDIEDGNCNEEITYDNDNQGYRGNTYTDISGVKIDEDSNNPLDTAARVFYNRTLGSLTIKNTTKIDNGVMKILDKEQIKIELNKDTTYCVYNKNNKSILYLVKTAYNLDQINTFNNILLYLNKCSEWKTVNNNLKQKLIKCDIDNNTGKTKKLEWIQLTNLLNTEDNISKKINENVKLSLIKIIHAKLFG